MMNNNKILTVSYGTFSCTLEGFDDSFGTMKAIAEYFRDLASDDRYFGAEPPQPDAEMLTRIAEREISRRVQAREHEGKIVLSATETEQTAEEAAPAPAVVQEDHAETEAAIAANAQLEAEEAQAALAAERAAEQARIEAEERAKAELAAEEKAEQERQVALAKAKAQAKAERKAAKQAEDQARLAAQAQKDAQEQAKETTVAPTPRDLAKELPEAEAFFADSDDVANPDVALSEELPVIEPQTPSIASKLQRIRAVVSQADEVDEEDDYSEDEHAETTSTQDAIADIIDDADSDVSHVEVLSENDVADAVETPAQDSTTLINDENDDDVASILASLTASQEETSSEPTPDETAEAEPTAAPTLAMEEDTVNLFADSLEADEEEEIPTPPAPARRVARVIKVKRAELEKAISQGALEEVQAQTQGMLSAEEEAELARELAAVEEDSVVPTPLAETRQQDAPAPETKPALPALEGEGSDDLARLMAEADNQMDEAESAQNRDAFAHLKAAVAAKKADLGLKIASDEDEQDVYRDDLATVVKPRRPAAVKRRSQRPTVEDRPAPLKLVAEQRVDSKPAAAQPGPIRPRRVAAAPEMASSAAVNAHSFADFAADMGADKLPDLLEAAAAYMAFVEGREQFSRPQLMTKVRQLEADNFSREDSLRSFGQLLRAGKIEKLQGGRFTVTNDIGFRPDARAAG